MKSFNIVDRLRAAYDAFVALPANVDPDDWHAASREMVAAQEAAFAARAPDRIRWALRDSFERRMAERARNIPAR